MCDTPPLCLHFYNVISLLYKVDVFPPQRLYLEIDLQILRNFLSIYFLILIKLLLKKNSLYTILFGLTMKKIRLFYVQRKIIISFV